jgi:hypothetical protein
MKNRISILAAFFVAGSLWTMSVPLFAHHSDAEWNRSPEITIAGTVTEWKFVNPHSEIHLDVTDDKGTVEKWIVYCCTPNDARRVGMNSKTFAAGEKLTIVGQPSRYGKKTMQHKEIRRAKGEVVPTNRNTPRDKLSGGAFAGGD